MCLFLLHTTLNRLTFLMVFKLSYILLVAATDIFSCLLMLLNSGLQRTLGILIPVWTCKWGHPRDVYFLKLISSLLCRKVPNTSEPRLNCWRTLCRPGFGKHGRIKETNISDLLDVTTYPEWWNRDLATLLLLLMVIELAKIFSLGMVPLKVLFWER